jgi:hypothetical protein
MPIYFQRGRSCRYASGLCRGPHSSDRSTLLDKSSDGVGHLMQVLAYPVRCGETFNLVNKPFFHYNYQPVAVFFEKYICLFLKSKRCTSKAPAVRLSENDSKKGTKGTKKMNSVHMDSIVKEFAKRGK